MCSLLDQVPAGRRIYVTMTVLADFRSVNWLAIKLLAKEF
jgi:hypothetical protein